MGGENIAHLLAEELKRWSNIYGVDPYETEPRVLLYDSVSKPPIEHLRYRPILIVEDVFEQGETAGEAWQHISNSKPSNIIGATLYLRSEAVTVPRFYFEEIDKNTVVIFPWDVEYVKQLISKNPEHKYTPEELYQVDGLLPLEVYRGVLAELK